jgi:hypothetical protein
LTRWGKIVEKAIEQAEEGDEKARQWLSDYALPKPGTKLWFSYLAAAEEFDVDPAEFDALEVFQTILSAKAYVKMAENCAAAKISPLSKTPLTDMLRAGLLWPQPARGAEQERQQQSRPGPGGV